MITELTAPRPETAWAFFFITNFQIDFFKYYYCIISKNDSPTALKLQNWERKNTKNLLLSDEMCTFAYVIFNFVTQQK